METRINAATLAWRRDVFEAYAGERRAAKLPGFRVESLADVTRHLPAGDDDEALLSFARFDGDGVGRVREELALMRARGLAVEWKVHDFDRPADLRSRLEAEGLRTHHEEALLVLDVAAAGEGRETPHGVVVEQARGAAIDEMARLQEEIWECRLPWLGGVLHEMADPVRGTGTAYCARVDGRMVGTGWIDFLGGSRFAQLCGGAVAARHRGRGIYTLLFERRLREARERGFPFVAVDAAPMSRPILERKGFRYVCGTYPMRSRPLSPLSRG